ncbi:MAG: hypothetical protein A3K09_08025 [Nitrospinae bacterium RIFCSPLOWO2_12_FULL_47_7]|nr:MAG: hypothetical protein A3K09_08025 [Nitrospinae bacterium RIFCSPLOWO2_12_FULL_47_7]
MVREIFSLLAYVSGFYVASMFQNALAIYVSKVLTNHTGARVVSFILIFIGTVIIVSFVGKGVGRLFSAAGGLSFFNRVMGGVIGLAKGVAVLLAIMAPLELFPDLYHSLTKGSKISPYLESASKSMRKGVGVKTDFRELVPTMPTMADMEEKLKDVEKMTDSVKQKAKGLSLPKGGKPQEEYSREDIKQLEKILKSIEKE